MGNKNCGESGSFGGQPSTAFEVGAAADARPGLRRLLLAAGAVMVALLVVFTVVQAWGPALLTSPEPWLESGRLVAATLGMGLLVIDALLPVPSSVVLVSLGALFGVAGGTALGMAGTMGGTVLAFGLGRLGQHRFSRWLPAGDQRTVDLVSQWGIVAIAATRPLPLLAETVAVLAGGLGVSWWRLCLGAAAGLLPTTAAYAVAGATGAKAGFIWVTVAMVGLGGLAWAVDRRLAGGPFAHGDSPEQHS